MKTNDMKHLLSILNIFVVFFTEYLYYLCFRDNNTFVHNVVYRITQVNLLYVKVFQAIALNHNWFDKTWSNKFYEFTDNVPWKDTDINWPLLCKVCVENEIILMKYIPINSGLISLVFQGIRRHEQVAIKMVRKNIRYKLENDVEQFHYLLMLLSYLPFLSSFLVKYKIKDIICKNTQILLDQTDFSKEVKNMVQFKKNCENLIYVKIPCVYENITCKYPEIIVMEFIKGMKIHEIKVEERVDFAKQIIKFGIVTSTIHGLIHGDLHSGNILFIKNNDDNDNDNNYIIGILDFGIVNEVDCSLKNVFFEMAGNWFNMSSRDIAEKMLHSGLIEPKNFSDMLSPIDYEHILSLTANIIEDSIANSKNVSHLQLCKFVSQFNQHLSNKNVEQLGIRPSDFFVKLQMVFAMTQGVVLNLCDENIIELIDCVVNEMFCTNILTS
jgi:predicted unusual protein kinase regulating ubiquinone biosynthesis (AarF/ABC1/UbiB family)